ncbi:hypothetical protein [Oceanobacillus kapialis]|uniref:hypothetical protein n=1 Tax=Oceanobacillus kapialis TaxID=481353 RepID=UPI00384BB539
MKSPIKNKKVYWSALISLFLSAALLFLMFYLRREGIYVQFGTPPPLIGYTLIENVFIFIAFLSICFLIKGREIKSFLIAVSFFVIVINSLDHLLIKPFWETKYTTLISPDNTANYVVAENGYGRLYKLSESGLYMTFIASTSTDDGYQPFTNDNYEIDWRSSKHFVIHYAFDRMSEEYSREIIVDLE